MEFIDAQESNQFFKIGRNDKIYLSAKAIVLALETYNQIVIGNCCQDNVLKVLAWVKELGVNIVCIPEYFKTKIDGKEKVFVKLIVKKV